MPKWSDAAFPAFLLVLIIFAKLPTANFDYYWDEMVFASQAKFLAVHGFLQAIPYGVMHPPLFLWIMAAAYSVFGESPFLSHAIIAVFSFIGAYFTYLLGNHLFGKRVGIAASLLLIFSPMYFAISGQALFDVPLTATTMATLYFGIRKKLLPFLLAGTALVLTKEPGFLAVLAITFFYVARREKPRVIVISLVPVMVFALWFVYAVAAGYLHQGVSFSSITLVASKALSNLYQVLIWNYNWALTVPVILALATRKVHADDLRGAAPLLLVGLLYLALFTIGPVPVLPRYLLPVMPVFFILAALCLDRTTRRPWFIIAIVLILFVSAYRWNDGLKGAIQDPVFSSGLLGVRLTSVENGELSLDYADAVDVETQATRYIFDNRPGSTVAAAWPLAHNMTLDTNAGYRQWRRYNITVLDPTAENIAKVDLLVVDDCCTPQGADLSKMELLRSFESGTKRAAVYKVH
jgi:4-amino-4-deoxy-L-arabinose transferase-like glycosyltransferase